MGRPDVEAFMDEMTPVEFQAWRVHYSKQLTPAERADLSSALAAFWICRILCSGLGVKWKDVCGDRSPLTPATFAPWLPMLKDFVEAKSRPQTEAEMKQAIRAGFRPS